MKSVEFTNKVIVSLRNDTMIRIGLVDIINVVLLVNCQAQVLVWKSSVI
jgi:hypothetical protein